jgi:(p)ppGpp synthase/HD superfamily hydrolase
MAFKAHGDQKYGTFPYSVHLNAVWDLCVPYGEDAEIIAFLHDTLEDTKLTGDEIQTAFGPFIRRCVEDLTDSPGSNRKIRKAATYARLTAISGASPEAVSLIVKAADRLANVRQSFEDGNVKLLDMYLKEHLAFRLAVYREGLNDVLIKEIDAILE